MTKVDEARKAFIDNIMAMDVNKNPNTSKVDHAEAKKAAEVFGKHAIEFVAYRVGRADIDIRCLIGFLVTDTDGYIVLEPRYDTNEEIHIPLKDVVQRISLSDAYRALSEENDELKRQVAVLVTALEKACVELSYSDTHEDMCLPSYWTEQAEAELEEEGSDGK